MWPVTAGAHICSSPGRCSQKRREHFQKLRPAPSILIPFLVITFCKAVCAHSSFSLSFPTLREMQKEVRSAQMEVAQKALETFSQTAPPFKCISSRFCAAASTQCARCAR